MKILFDQGAPAPLRRHLPGHSVDTAFERGWSELENGALLSMLYESVLGRAGHKVAVAATLAATGFLGVEP